MIVKGVSFFLFWINTRKLSTWQHLFFIKRFDRIRKITFRENTIIGNFIKLAFSRFFDVCGNLGNAKEKPTIKTSFSRKMKRLVLRIYLAKFCNQHFFHVNGVFIAISWKRDVETGENMLKFFKTKTWA